MKRAILVLMMLLVAVPVLAHPCEPVKKAAPRRVVQKKAAPLALASVRYDTVRVVREVHHEPTLQTVVLERREERSWIGPVVIGAVLLGAVAILNDDGRDQVYAIASAVASGGSGGGGGSGGSGSSCDCKKGKGKGKGHCKH